MKPQKTLTRWGKLETVFPARIDKDLHALIACLCVLFEDLRIEVSGIVERDLGTLDECGRNGRQLYFQRRSLATLYEFGEVLQSLEDLPSFIPVKARFSAMARKHWTHSIDYFRKYDRYVARLRNNVGGHFRKQAGMFAIEHFRPEVTGKLEVAFYGGGGGAKLFFADEIAATSALRQVSGKTSEVRARKLVRHSLVAYRQAVRAVDCIVGEYLWDRFGV
jgi:hypothetical protein